MTIEQPFEDGQNNSGALGTNASLRGSQITLQVQFKDLTGAATNPTNPKFKLVDPEVGEVVSVEVLGVTQNQDHTYTPEALGSGRYSVTFMTTGLRECIYQVEWTGEYIDIADARTHTRIIAGTVGIGSISYTQDYLNRVVARLMDDHPEEYRLDEPVAQWRPSQLVKYLRDAVGRFNAIGPRYTTCTIDTFPAEIDELLVTGTVIIALRARARLEIANTMSYTDGHTLNIDRAPKYMQLADTLSREWIEAVISYKKATPPKPIGIRSQRVPFRINRVIGLLPNYKSFFSG